MDRNDFVSVAAWRTMDLLHERRALLFDQGTAMWVWPRTDRVILIMDPAQVDLRKLNDVFAHELSTRLAGRRVVRTNSRGLFLQVGYEIPPAPATLTDHALDLTGQPSAWHLPIGMTREGPLWISLLEGDSFLIGGSRAMGKTALLHGWIQALLAGGRTQIYAHDGKANAEFLRYAGDPHYHHIGPDGLPAQLAEIAQLARRRMQQLAASGHPNILTYNAQANAGFLEPIALIVDEVAEVADQAALVQNVRLYRAAGVFPIFATNDPGKATVVAKTNLSTRISLAVPSHNDSLTILGRSGAHRLAKIPGRGMLERGGRLVEFQAYRVSYPPLSRAGQIWLEEHAYREEYESAPAPAVATDAERIQELAAQGLSRTAIVREIWHVHGGDVFMRGMERVKQVLGTTTTTGGPTSAPISPAAGLAGQ